VTGFFRTYAVSSPHPNGSVAVTPCEAVEGLPSDLGSIQLEFSTLSALTGDPRFAVRAAQIQRFIFSRFPAAGLLPGRLNVRNGWWTSGVKGLDSMSDSLYEYLIKAWLLTRGAFPVLLERGLKATDEAEAGLARRAGGSATYIARQSDKKVDHTMSHLATFAAGMLALGAVRHLRLADELVTSCTRLYAQQNTGLMPECVTFGTGRAVSCDARYRLGPESVESLFVLHRLTGLRKCRDYAWTIFRATERACRVENGYATSADACKEPPKHEDLMDSCLLAETLKYLFIIFSASDLVPVDVWVFNTETHPLRVWTPGRSSRCVRTSSSSEAARGRPRSASARRIVK